MRFLFKFVLVMLLAAVVALPVMLVAVVLAAVDDTPLLARTADIRPENIARARRILERNDPRRMRPGVLRGIVVGNEDLDLALNYLANQYGRGSASVQLREGGAQVRASLALPANPLGKYVNIDAALSETRGLPRIEALTVGRLPVPEFVANRMLEWALAKLGGASGGATPVDAIKQVAMRGGALLVVYEWNDQLPGKLSGMLVSREDEGRLKAYQERLVQLADTGGSGVLPMEQVLQALLRAAAQRGGDAAAENRAAIIALAFFVNGKGLAALVPAARDWQRPAPRNVTLDGRHDFAQHYSISAAIAAAAGSPLADAVGLYKEIDDSRGGSGFSFNDIAADRAGTRFGELSISSAEGAQRMQRLAVGGLSAAAIFPAVSDLPEFMAEAELKRRFGGVNGTEYKRMMAEIERRIASLPVFRH